MKTKLFTLMLVFSMVITGVISFSSVAKAGNIMDTQYEFNNTGTTGQSEWRDKNDDTYVYIKPTEGPTIYYTVYGKSNNKGPQKCSSRVSIPVGTQASVVNLVKERGYTQAQLKFDRITYAMAYTRGVWSPDSVGVFTVYPYTDPYKDINKE